MAQSNVLGGLCRNNFSSYLLNRPHPQRMCRIQRMGLYLQHHPRQDWTIRLQFYIAHSPVEFTVNSTVFNWTEKTCIGCLRWAVGRAFEKTKQNRTFQLNIKGGKGTLLSDCILTFQDQHSSEKPGSSVVTLLNIQNIQSQHCTELHGKVLTAVILKVEVGAHLDIMKSWALPS